MAKQSVRPLEAVGMVAAWSVVFCLSAAAQLLTPSGVRPNTGGPLYRMLPRAWMRVVVKFPGVRDGGPDRTTTSELSSGPEHQERVIGSTEFQSAADLQALLTDGALTFHDVPSEAPVRLRITIRSRAGALLRSFATSYVLHFPSGYLGDFVIDHVNADVTRMWRDK
jgi:hypothetical protein